MERVAQLPLLPIAPQVRVAQGRLAVAVGTVVVAVAVAGINVQPQALPALVAQAGRVACLVAGVAGVAQLAAHQPVAATVAQAGAVK